LQGVLAGAGEGHAMLGQPLVDLARQGSCHRVECRDVGCQPFLVKLLTALAMTAMAISQRPAASESVRGESREGMEDVILSQLEPRQFSSVYGEVTSSWQTERCLRC
jgi:hypothetical protein